MQYDCAAMVTSDNLDDKLIEIAEDMIADGKRARGYIEDYLREYDLPINPSTIDMVWDLIKPVTRKHTMA
jgi:hypothetical protein